MERGRGDDLRKRLAALTSHNGHLCELHTVTTITQSYFFSGRMDPSGNQYVPELKTGIDGQAIDTPATPPQLEPAPTEDPIS